MTTSISHSVSQPARDVVDGVRDVIVTTLGLEDQADRIGPDTILLGELPELDSLAIVELVVVLEERFGITVEDDDVTGEAFASVGTLAELVALRLA
jgi:acyl carrier protein